MASHDTRPENSRPIMVVFQDIIRDLQGLLRSEFLLAKAEASDELAKAAGASKMLAAGAAIAFYGLGLLLLTCVYALQLVVAPWLAALIVGVATLIASGVVVGVGVNRIKQVRGLKKTVESIKENARWTKQQVT